MRAAGHASLRSSPATRTTKTSPSTTCTTGGRNWSGGACSRRWGKQIRRTFRSSNPLTTSSTGGTPWVASRANGWGRTPWPRSTASCGPCWSVPIRTASCAWRSAPTCAGGNRARVAPAPRRRIACRLWETPAAGEARPASEAAELWEVGEAVGQVGDLLEQSQTVGAHPLVLHHHEDVVEERIEAGQVQFLRVAGVRLEDHLELRVHLDAVGVVAVAAVVRADARLDVGDPPRLRAEHAQVGGRVHRA